MDAAQIQHSFKTLIVTIIFLLVAMAIVSNLPHREDHRFLISCIAQHLGVSGVPEI